MEDLWSLSCPGETPASASGPCLRSEMHFSGSPLSRSDRSPGSSSESCGNGSNAKATSTSNRRRLARDLEKVGVRRIADEGLAYLYVVSLDDSRCKIGCSGDMAQRSQWLWGNDTRPLRIHALFAMTRDDVLTSERRAKDLNPHACVRNSRNGLTLTDWFALPPAEAVALARRAILPAQQVVASYLFDDFSLDRFGPPTPPRPPKKVSVNLRLPADVADLLRAAGDERGISAPAMAAELIARALSCS